MYKFSIKIIFGGLILTGLVGPMGDLFPATLTGQVARPSALDAGPKLVDRYRGRTSAIDHNEPVGPGCDPGKCAVIFLTGDSLPPVLPLTGRPSINQKDMMFQPSVLAVSVGTTVEFPNLDPFFHNVFSYSATKKFDLGRYAQGKSKSIKFDRPGLVKIFCEIHYPMRAYLHVLNTPYFCVSDDDGDFVISNIKPGVYTLHVWQEYQTELQRPLTVTEDSLYVIIK